MTPRTTGADPSTVRRLNERTVVAALSALGPARVSQVAAATGLTVPAVRDILRSLAEKGWVCDVPAASGGVGRPARMVRLTEPTLRVLGVDLGGHTVRAVLSDATGNAEASAEVPAPWPRTSLQATREAIQELLSQIDLTQVWTTGLAVTGALTPDGLLTRSIGLPHLAGARPAEALADLLPGDVLTCHDTRAALWAEHESGTAQGVHDVMLLNLGRRPSISLLLGGRPHYGAHGNAGELSLNELLPARYGWDGLDDEGDQQGGALRAALAGDAQAVAGAQQFLAAITDQVAFAAGLVDPALVVVGGPLGAVLAPSLPGFREQLAARLDHAPDLVATGLDQFSSALGAAHLARQRLWHTLLDGPDGVVPLTRAGYVAARRTGS